MEQYDVINTEYSEQELSEEALAEITGGSFFKSLGRGLLKGVKAVGRFGRDGAAAIGITTIINDATHQNGGQ